VTLGEAVRRIRTHAGKTQVDFAATIDITANALSLIETGNRGVSVYLCEEIAARYGVCPRTLSVMSAPGHNPKLYQELLDN